MRSRGPLLWDVSLLAVLARCLLLLAAQNEMADEDVAVDVDAAGVGPRFFYLSVSLYSPALSVGGPQRKLGPLLFAPDTIPKNGNRFRTGSCR